MKRFALGALVLFVSTAALASETQRYLVATQRPARATSLGSLAHELSEPRERRVASFSIVDGFAADLTPSEAAALRRSSGVRWVEPVVARELFAVSTPGQQIVPYGVTQLRAPEAWAGRRAAPVNVAVIDSGIDYRHPELAAAWAGGLNTVKADATALDAIGHGTHVSGIIAAADNAFGVVGVAPGIRLWGVKVASDEGEITTEDVIEGLDWVVAKKKELGGQWVVNLSLGGEESSDIEREAFARGIAAGLAIVAATGNSSTVTLPAAVSFPAAYPNVISVGATDELQVLAAFSNQGPEVDFVAPGVRVVSTLLTGTAVISYVQSSSVVANAKPMIGSKLATLTGQYVYCGLGEAKDFTSAVQGKIALIRRGVDSFAAKTRRAMQAGATGVVIFNNNDTAFSFTLIDPEDPTTKDEIWPVAVGISRVDGEALVATGTGTITIGYEPDDYGGRNGTSMSSPHVAGAVALLWALAPNATPDNIVSALIATATDLGTPGKDDLYGYGQIDLFAAAKMLAPEAFNPAGGRTGRRFVTRQRK